MDPRPSCRPHVAGILHFRTLEQRMRNVGAHLAGSAQHPCAARAPSGTPPAIPRNKTELVAVAEQALMISRQMWLSENNLKVS